MNKCYFRRASGFLLGLVLIAVTLVACGGGDEKGGEKGPTSVSAYKSQGEFPEMKEQLTWEGINSIPVKRSDMTVDEARALCVDFFRYAKTALWTPDEDISYTRNAAGSQDEMKKGLVYGGLPYIDLGSGNIYRLMDYMDEETGVVDISNASDVLKSFGNQCSIGAWWGWARVTNSTDYKWSQTCVVSHGLKRVGPYTYDDNLDEFRPNFGTVDVINGNTTDIMYKSYAELQPGDGLVYHVGGGHVAMCASKAQVVYLADGTIDGNNSFITIIDQGQKWNERTNASGETFTRKNGVDTKKTFAELLEAAYIPFAFPELLGEDPIEETEVKFSYQDESITKAQLFESKVTANYSISDIYAIIYDSKGNEVYKHAVRCLEANIEELAFIEKASADAEFDNVEIWGKWEFSADESYTLKVIAQLGTGERPTLWEGKLA